MILQRIGMVGSVPSLAFAVLGLLVTAGCASSPWSTQGASSQREMKPPSAAPPQVPLPGPPPQPAATTQAQAMQAVMQELQQLGTLDPATQESLMADLRQTDPALWPLVMQQFRAAVAYRQRSQQKGHASGLSSGPAPTGQMIPNATGPASAFSMVPRSAQPQAPSELIGRLPTTDDATIAPVQAPAENYARTAEPQFANRPAAVGATAQQPAGDKPSAQSDGRVFNASYEAATPADWRSQVASAAQSLETNLPAASQTPEQIAQQAQLRMLYLLAGRRDDAVRPIPSMPAATSEFLSKELYGLATWLDVQRTPDAPTRAAESKRILAEAADRLGESATLVVRNLAFCTKIQSYGCHEKFKQYEFAPEQEVLLYAELENFGIESTPKGHHTQLRSSYQIFDAQGQRIDDHQFTTTEEYCQNPRRDFFIGYHLRLPSRIYPGEYTLQLTIEDLKSKKVGQSSIKLTIKGKPK